MYFFLLFKKYTAQWFGYVIGLLFANWNIYLVRLMYGEVNKNINYKNKTQ